MLRRLLLWTALCSISAAPSFVLAGEGVHDPRAMCLGVGVFILLYTAWTSTAAFQRFARRPFVRRTLYIGYGTRLAISVASIVPPTAVVDLVPGMISIGFVKLVLGLDPETFGGTLLTTLVQGTLLNALIGLYMLIVWGLLRSTGTPRPPEETVGHAFEVITAPPPAATPPAAAGPPPRVQTLPATARPPE